MVPNAQQNALWAILELLRARGEDWKRDPPQKARKPLSIAENRFSLISKSELETLVRYGNGESFKPNTAIYIEPPGDDPAAVIAIWCQWNLAADTPALGCYVGYWSMVPRFPKPEIENGEEQKLVPGFVGYRFETPGVGDDEKHVYHHAQPCRSLGLKNREFSESLPVSNRIPAFPISAKDPVELLACAVLSVYGLKKLRELRRDFEEDPLIRQNIVVRNAIDSVVKRIAAK